MKFEILSVKVCLKIKFFLTGKEIISLPLKAGVIPPLLTSFEPIVS